MRTLLAAALLAAVPAGAVEIAAAPLDFALASAKTGKEVRLSSLRGKVVLVELWAENCGPCKKWKPYFEKLRAKYPSSEFAVVGINSGDSAETAARVLNARPSSYEELLDPDKTLLKSFHLMGVPMMVLVDPSGYVQWVSAGFTPDTPKDLEWRIDFWRPMPAAEAKKS